VPITTGLSGHIQTELMTGTPAALYHLKSRTLVCYITIFHLSHASDNWNYFSTWTNDVIQWYHEIITHTHAHAHTWKFRNEPSIPTNHFRSCHVLGPFGFFAWTIKPVQNIKHSLRILLLFLFTNVWTLEQKCPSFRHSLQEIYSPWTRKVTNAFLKLHQQTCKNYMSF